MASRYYLATTSAYPPAVAGQPRTATLAWWVADRTISRPMRGPFAESDARRVLAELRTDAQRGRG
jgi:hypothetical protein